MTRHRFWYLSAFISTTRSHGLWSGIRLSFVLARSVVRPWLGVHRDALGGVTMLALLAGAVWLLVTTTLNAPVKSGAAAWQAAVLFAVATAGLVVGCAHFLLRPTSRPLVLYQALKAVMLSVALGFVAFLGYERWLDLHRIEPAGATLMGILVMAVLLGFHETISSFIRSAMFRGVLDGVAAGELKQFLALDAEGRWRVAIHEAGHAAAYGLCSTIPEDAYACLEPDLLSMEAGAVGFPRPDATEMTKERMEWMMICSEAGPAAEELFFGDRCLAGVMDVNQLHGLANAYLLAGFGEPIDMEPATEPALHANRLAIGRVREKITSITAGFMALNKDTIEKIANRLLEVEFMDCKDLQGALQDATPLPDRSLMSWPGSIASVPR